MPQISLQVSTELKVKLLEDSARCKIGIGAYIRQLAAQGWCGWRDMETAPRDGRVLLVWHNSRALMHAIETDKHYAELVGYDALLLNTGAVVARWMPEDELWVAEHDPEIVLYPVAWTIIPRFDHGDGYLSKPLDANPNL